MDERQWSATVLRTVGFEKSQGKFAGYGGDKTPLTGCNTGLNSLTDSSSNLSMTRGALELIRGHIIGKCATASTKRASATGSRVNVEVRI